MRSRHEFSRLASAAIAAAAAAVTAGAGGEEPVPEPPPGWEASTQEELEKRIGALEEKIAALEAQAAEDVEAEDVADETFLKGTRVLSAMNPEISVTLDLLGKLVLNRDFYAVGDGEDGTSRSGLEVRVAEFAIQSSLDPFSSMKLVLALEGGEICLEEGFVTWTGIASRLSITLGRFKQGFGIVNRWHEHAFDQVDRPLALSKYMGEEGLGGTGISLRILLPRAWAHAEELTIEIATGENDALLAGEFFSIPSVLGRLKSFWDASGSTYVELGLSGLWGNNNHRGILDEASGDVHDEPFRQTILSGIDLSVVWRPAGMEKYRSVAWRSEAVWLHKQTEDGTFDAVGGYTYLDVRVNQILILGARLDVGMNPETGHAGWFWQASPYLTVWQSEFVFMRLQYGFTWESKARDPEHLVMLQVDLCAGPHRHDKY